MSSEIARQIFSSNRTHSIIAFLALSPALLLTIPQFAFAAPTPDEYDKALQIAQKKVQREASVANAGALSVSPASRLVGRFYEVGDRWDVAVWQNQPTQMRRTSDPDHLKTPQSPPSFFRYEVTEVKTGADARVVLRVQQLGEKALDGSVEFLRIELTAQLLQKKKAYKLASRADPVAVSPEGIRSHMTPLEMLPLDFPNVLTAEQRPAKALPEIPEYIAQAAQGLGYAPDLSKSLWLEQDDFFGRPVQVLWQHGDPWPAYLKTAQGIAIMIRSRGNS